MTLTLGLHLFEDFFWSAIAATGFALLFNVPRRTLLTCALLGGIGHLSRTVTHEFLPLDLASATLIGSTIIGFGGHLFSKPLQVPHTILSVPGVIPMIPGTFAYKAMIGFLRFSESASSAGPSALLIDASSFAVQTILILSAIAVGIAIPNLLIFRKRPII